LLHLRNISRGKDVDLERRQIIIRAGKGDKDRVTVVPDSLAQRLAEHRERLRGLHGEDQCGEVPGVWLPESLERKYPKTGQSWEWQWFFPSRQLMKDPRTGLRRRHPDCEKAKCYVWAIWRYIGKV